MINTLLKRRMENTKKNKKGFTLVELIVVLVIIAILAAVLIPTMTNYIGKARKSAAMSSAKTMVTACAAAATDVIGESGGFGADDGLTADTACTTFDDTKGFAKAATGYGAVFTKSGVTDKCITSVTIDADGSVTNLVYKEGKYTVTYADGKYTVAP